MDFETAYGYRDSRGWGCGELHAMLVAELANYLLQAGVRWKWMNEFTGEIHDGEDISKLTELIEGGQKANNWFQNTVVPVIGGLLADPR